MVRPEVCQGMELRSSLSTFRAASAGMSMYYPDPAHATCSYVYMYIVLISRGLVSSCLPLLAGHRENELGALHATGHKHYNDYTVHRERGVCVDDAHA